MYIDFDLLCNISEYAKKHLESSKHLYLKRKQNKDKIFQNILSGKIAEYNAYFYLREKNYSLIPPDLEIYNNKNKSHDSDLYIPEKDIHIHVKSINLNNCKIYGNTFLIEKTDPLYKSPKPNHYYMVMKQRDFINYDVFKWIRSDKCIFSDPINNLPTKKAVYL